MRASRGDRDEEVGAPISWATVTRTGACCQDKYILGELFVRTDWEVIGSAEVSDDKNVQSAMA